MPGKDDGHNKTKRDGSDPARKETGATAPADPRQPTKPAPKKNPEAPNPQRGNPQRG